jgi:DNA-directed RNA polymerase subunit RPC12/RpoP
MNQNPIQCPRCGHSQISANKMGWTSHSVFITCLKCGKQFKPGDDLASIQARQRNLEEAMKSPVFWVFMGIAAIFMIWLYNWLF